MIKINKNFKDIPISLRVPNLNLNLETNDESILTHKYRLKVIDDKSFRTVEKMYPDLYKRYKTPDIKEKLDLLYKNCAYCESEFTNSIKPTIEHYRPKGRGEYYWLAFSWDNIFYACGKCNNPQAGEKGKGNKFGISGTKVDFDPNDLSNINSLSEKYNTIEKPKFINPEFEDPELKLFFNEQGEIKSDDERYRYTILEIGLDRLELNQRRKTVIDEFIRSLEKIETDASIDKKNKVRQEIIQFISHLNNYLAFRRYAIKHLLKERIQKLIQ